MKCEKRRKIGFIVQEDWHSVHFGVRNYFSTIASILAEFNRVDFLVYKKNGRGKGMWYIEDSISVPHEEEKLMGITFSAQTSANFLKFSDIETYTKNRVNNNEQGFYSYYQCIGSDTAAEEYDLIVITNPWLVDFDVRVSARKVVGIVYDLIANQFSLTKMTLDYTWAYLHNNGYQYYLKYCDEIYAISKSVAEEFNEYYRTDRCYYFPPFPPYQFNDVKYEGELKENAVLLAAPFDPRKGIDRIPELLNPIAEYVDTLYIYGMPRCTEDMFNHMFRELHIKEIVYYPSLSYENLIRLYKKCKVLLFPSIEEGLGLPIIEAQICGCRVVTTNKEPMKDLAIEGSYLIGDDYVERISEMLNTKYKYEELSINAKDSFSYSKVIKEFEEIMR